MGKASSWYFMQSDISLKSDTLNYSIFFLTNPKAVVFWDFVQNIKFRKALVVCLL